MTRASAHNLPEAAAPRREASPTDAELVRRLSDGDLSPLGVLYDRHHEGVRQFLVRARSCGADADDLTHEAFLTLAKIAGRYDGRASARPFLLGIAAQLVRRRKRGLMRWAQALTTFAGAGADVRGRTPEDDAGANEEMRRFERALARLTEEKRLVFLLIEREGLSGEEVGRALAIPVNTVWTRLHHARHELRRALGAEGAVKRAAKLVEPSRAQPADGGDRAVKRGSAEEKGFEPLVQLPVRRFSKPLP